MEYEVELKTKPEFTWSHIPIVKVKANDESQAVRKALDYVDRNLGYRRIAIELVNVRGV